MSAPGDEFLHDEAGWRKEVAAVIQDVEECVQAISIADNLESNSKTIYLNLTTKEQKNFTIELTGQGFRICGNEHNSTDIKPTDYCDYFETPYSLLSQLSPGFIETTGQALCKKLEKLSQERRS